MNILKMYFETEAGQTHPSKSIKRLAQIIYWIYLIGGLVALVGCLLAAFSIMDYNHEAGYLYLFIAVLCPFVCKLIGWLTSLSLRAIAVVVESHEKNLSQSISVKPIFTDEDTPRKPAVPTDGWICKSCGKTNPRHIGTCPECGATK